MAETGNIQRQRLTICIGDNTLSFTQPNTDAEGLPILFEPYVVKSGISMAANMRAALKEIKPAFDNPQRCRVLIDTPVLMMPMELFEEQDKDIFYTHAYPLHHQDVVLFNVLPELKAVVLFAINKDLKLVVDDNFQDASFICAMVPVWRYLHQRSFSGPRNKLYAYFREHRLDIFSFNQNHFKYCNSFETSHGHDALYYLLYVWKQLQLSPEHDEMHIVGDIPDRDWLFAELRKYLQKAYIINPSADFNRVPVTNIKGMPYHLLTLFVKGR